MKRIVILIASILLVLGFTSCLDSIQYITMNDKGEIEMSFMLTISKSLFEMGGGGESLEDTLYR